VRRSGGTATARLIPFTDTTTGIGAPGSGLWTTFADDNTHSAIENTAVFAAVTYKPLDNLELGAEVRSARETQERLPGQTQSLAYFTDLSRNSAFDSITNIAYQKGTFDSVTPRFTARYDVTPSNHIYAVVAKGTKPGGLNSANADLVGFGHFEEESAWSYELGTKNTFLDNRLLLNASVFRNKIDGYQLTDSIVYQDGTPSTVVKNVGKVQITGLELEAGYAPESIRGLNVRLNYSYIKTKIQEGLDLNEGVLADVADDGQVNCSLGLSPAGQTRVNALRAQFPSLASTLICNDATGAVYFGKYGSIAGRKLPRVPEHNINLGLDYSRPLAGDWILNTGANLSYESKKYVQVDNLAYYGEATLLSAHLGFSNDNYAISLWGKNLTDEDSVIAASRFTDATNQTLRAFFGTNRLPRQFGLTPTVKF
jgi:outer membrane receptor protein involved in Fe transport